MSAELLTTVTHLLVRQALRCGKLGLSPIPHLQLTSNITEQIVFALVNLRHLVTYIAQCQSFNLDGCQRTVSGLTL